MLQFLKINKITLLAGLGMDILTTRDKQTTKRSTNQTSSLQQSKKITDVNHCIKTWIDTLLYPNPRYSKTGTISN